MGCCCSSSGSSDAQPSVNDAAPSSNQADEPLLHPEPAEPPKSRVETTKKLLTIDDDNNVTFEGQAEVKETLGFNQKYLTLKGRYLRMCAKKGAAGKGMLVEDLTEADELSIKRTGGGEYRLTIATDGKDVVCRIANVSSTGFGSRR